MRPSRFHRWADFHRAFAPGLVPAGFPVMGRDLEAKREDEWAGDGEGIQVHGPIL